MSHLQRFFLTLAAALAYFVAIFMWPLVVGLGALVVALVSLSAMAWELTG